MKIDKCITSTEKLLSTIEQTFQGFILFLFFVFCSFFFFETLLKLGIVNSRLSQPISA